MPAAGRGPEDLAKLLSRAICDHTFAYLLVMTNTIKVTMDCHFVML